MAARWKAKELEYLERNYHKNDIADLIKKIGKTEDAIRWKASSIGVLIRDGRQERASHKLTISLTKKLFDKLQKEVNISATIREALKQYYNLKKL